MAKKECLSILIGAEEKAALESLALEHGFLWGSKPNLSLLIRAIARGELAIARVSEPEKLRRKIKELQKELDQMKDGWK